MPTPPSTAQTPGAAPSLGVQTPVQSFQSMPVKTPATNTAGVPNASNVSDTDYLTNVVNSVTGQLKAQGAPQSDIDNATNTIYGAYGKYTQAQQDQQSGGFGSGTAANSILGQGVPASQYAASPQAQSGVILPDQSANLVSVAGHALVNSVSDAWDIGKGLINMVSHPIQTVEQLWKDPTSLAGPALQQLGYGIFGAVGDLAEGKTDQAASTAWQGVQKALIAFGNHPLSSIIAPVYGAEGLSSVVDAISHPMDAVADVAARAQSASTFLQLAKDDPIGAGKYLTTSLLGPFQKVVQNGIDNSFAGRMQAITGSLKAASAIDDTIASNPDQATWMAQLQKTAGAIKDNTGDATALLPHVQALGEGVSSEFTSMIAQRDALLQLAKNAGDNIGDFSLNSAKTLLDNAQTAGFKTSTELAETEAQRASAMKGTAQGLYNANLVGPSGAPIPVDATPIIDAYPEFLDRVNQAASPEELDQLRAQQQELIFRQSYAESGGNEGLALRIAKDKYGMGFDGPNLTNPDYYRGMTANGLAGLRDRFVSQMEGMNAPTQITSAFNDILKSQFDQARDTAVESVNPQGLKNVQQADAYYARYRTMQEQYGVGKSDPQTVANNIYKDWNNFSQTESPDIVMKAQQLKASQILSDAMETDAITGKTSVNVQKLFDGIAKNQNILGPELSTQLQGIVDANQKMSLVQDAIKQQAATLTTASESAAKIPQDQVEFENQVRGIKSLADVKAISKASGLTPEELGKTAINSIYEEYKGKFGTASGQKLNLAEVKPMLADWNKIGGGTETASVIKEMFPDGPNGEPNPIRQSFSDLQKLSDDYDKATGGKKTAIGRAMNVGIGGLFAAIGHLWMGMGFLRRATVGLGGDADAASITGEGEAGTATTPPTDNSLIGKVKSKISSGAQTVVRSTLNPTPVAGVSAISSTAQRQQSQ